MQKSFSTLTKRLRKINNDYFFNELTNRLRKINKKYNFNENNESYTKYDEKTDKPDSWYTQFIQGCILVSLVNGKFLPNIFKQFKPNKLFSFFKLEEAIYCINFQWYIINKWHVLTGYLPIDKEYYDKLKSNINLLKIILNDTNKSHEIKKIILETIDILKYKTKIFSINENTGDSLIDGTWNAGKLNLKAIPINTINNKLEFITNLPKNSLICYSGHWIVFLGCKDDNLITINPLIHNELTNIPFNKIDYIDAIIKKE